MADQVTPRSVVKAVLRGEPPPRPLLMPIIFSLGSRLENLPLRDFQSNPTKIANALRQIHSVLKVDGLACYFDPLLEAEALGCMLEWQLDGSPALVCPQFSGVNHLRQQLHSPDEIGKKGRVRVASEVLQRLKVMLKGEPALMVGVTGPLTLAAQLLGERSGAEDPLPLDLVEFAAEVTAAVSKNLVESGADVVLLVEDSLPDLPAGTYEKWASVIGPIMNVIRFYDALPVLLWHDTARVPEACRNTLDRNWNCVYCLGLSETGTKSWDRWQSKGLGLGVALPPNIFLGSPKDGELAIGAICAQLPALKLLLLTSAGDIPPMADLKHVVAVLESLRGACATATCGSKVPLR